MGVIRRSGKRVYLIAICGEVEEHQKKTKMKDMIEMMNRLTKRA